MTIDSFSGANRFLSNFYPCPVVYDGELYPTSEHAYQAAKTLDDRERREIRAAKTPGEAKRLGQRVDMRPDWDHRKLEIMEEILRAKFTEPSMRDALKRTGDQMLVEGNNWGDRYWGICRGTGSNHLGKLLMKIRADIP